MQRPQPTPADDSVPTTHAVDIKGIWIVDVIHRIVVAGLTEVEDSSLTTQQTDEEIANILKECSHIPDPLQPWRSMRCMFPDNVADSSKCSTTSSQRFFATLPGNPEESQAAASDGEVFPA